eukprot:144553-Amphidinium_carterae.1
MWTRFVLVALGTPVWAPEKACWLGLIILDRLEVPITCLRQGWQGEAPDIVLEPVAIDITQGGIDEGVRRVAETHEVKALQFCERGQSGEPGGSELVAL